MWGKLKRLLLKAAFAEKDDWDLVSTAAWEAAGRIVAAHGPYTSGEAEGDAAYAA